MLRALSQLLGSIPDEAGRSEVLQLAREIHEAGRREQGPQRDLEQQQLLHKMTERLRWHFRSARYALPGPGELQQMIDEHFR